MGKMCKQQGYNALQAICMTLAEEGSEEMYVIVLHQKTWGEGQGECLWPVLCLFCATFRQSLSNIQAEAQVLSWLCLISWCRDSPYVKIDPHV